MTVTWYLNRHWVFSRTSDRTREYGAYFGVQVVGAAINLGTYALVIAMIPSLARLPVLPLAAGAVLALLFNYSAASRWVFAASGGPQRMTTPAFGADVPPPYTGVENLEVMREAENYNRYLQSLVERHAGDARRVIDFGAGSGTFAIPCAAAGLDVTAVEPDDRLRAMVIAAGMPPSPTSRRCRTMRSSTRTR